MQINNLKDLNNMHIDTLKEVTNIGSGNAATSLSSMLNTKIEISVPEVSILSFNDVVKKVGLPEEILFSVLISLNKDINGMAMLLFKNDFIIYLFNILLQKEYSEENIVKDLDEMEQSVLKEISNIMVSSYINALCSLTSLKINISTPLFCMDMLGSILNVPATFYAQMGDEMIVIKNKFFINDKSIDSSIILAPDVHSLKVIMNALGL